MHIFQAFTKQDRRPLKGALLGTMHSRPAHETPTRTKEQVSISIGEMTKGIKGVAVHGNGTRRENNESL
jgi:hypothetical protein